jgi:SlyX protein
MTQRMQHPMQQRIDELEMKAAFQEQVIQDLNDELIRHGTRITQLEQQMTRLIENAQNPEANPEETTDPTDERPPHY